MPIAECGSFDAYLRTDDVANKLQAGRLSIAAAAAAAALPRAGDAWLLCTGETCHAERHAGFRATLQSVALVRGFSFVGKHAAMLSGSCACSCFHNCKRDAGAHALDAADVDEYAAKVHLLSVEYAVVATRTAAERLADTTFLRQVSAAQLERKLRYLTQRGWTTCGLGSRMLRPSLPLIVARVLFAEQYRCAVLATYHNICARNGCLRAQVHDYMIRSITMTADLEALTCDM